MFGLMKMQVVKSTDSLPYGISYSFFFFGYKPKKEQKKKKKRNKQTTI